MENLLKNQGQILVWMDKFWLLLFDNIGVHPFEVSGWCRRSFWSYSSSAGDNTYKIYANTNFDCLYTCSMWQSHWPKATGSSQDVIGKKNDCLHALNSVQKGNSAAEKKNGVQTSRMLQNGRIRIIYHLCIHSPRAERNLIILLEFRRSLRRLRWNFVRSFKRLFSHRQ